MPFPLTQQCCLLSFFCIAMSHRFDFVLSWNISSTIFTFFDLIASYYTKGKCQCLFVFICFEHVILIRKHFLTSYFTPFTKFTEAFVQRCSVKKVFLEISLNSQENICARVCFLIKFQACNFIKKETLSQVFTCEFSEIFKSTFFYGTPLVAASTFNLKSLLNQMFSDLQAIFCFCDWQINVTIFSNVIIRLQLPLNR